MIGNSGGGGRGPTTIPMTGGSATGDLSRVWDAAANGDTVAAQRLIALGREHPGLGRVLDQMAGRSGPPRDVQSGRFLPRNIAPAAQGGISSTQTLSYYRDFHQFAIDFHRATVTNRIVSNQPYGPFRPAGQFGPFAPGGPIGPQHPNYYGVFPPSAPPPGPTPSVPPSGPTMGPWGPRGRGRMPPPGSPPGGPPSGGGGGGWGGWGGGGGGGWGGFPIGFGPGRGGLGAAGGGLGGAFGHYGILRGILVGEIAGALGGEFIKDILNPDRLSTEILSTFSGAIQPYIKAATPYYRLGTTGGFSGKDLFSQFIKRDETTGEIVPGQDFMTKYGVTQEEIARNFAAFGLFPHSAHEGRDIARNLAVGQRLPGFAGLDPGIPLGLARQAGGLGMETTVGATDQYLRKMAEYGVRWTHEGVDAAQVFKNMSGSLDIIAKSGATGISADAVQRIFDQSIASGLPGARTGALGAQMIGGEQAALNTAGGNPSIDALNMIGLQAAGGFNATGLKNFLGPEVMKAIGGEGGQQFQQMLQAIQQSDFIGLSALIGLARQSVPGSGTGAAATTLRGTMGLPPALTGVILRNQYGQPIAPSMGLRGTQTPWTAPTDTGGTIEQNLRRSAARYGIDPDDFVRMAKAEGLGAPFGEMDTNRQMSYGALRMNMGGLGAEFEKANPGMKASDPANEAAMNDWAAWYASTHGFGSWSAVRFGKVPAPRITGGVATGGAGGAPGMAHPGVDPELDAAMRYGASHLPPGYRAEFTSGRRHRGDGSQHDLGKAEDWRIFGPNGEITPYGPDTTGMYQKLHIEALRYMLAVNPEKAKIMRWGGHFGNQIGGGGPLDLEHTDIGGDTEPRGRYGDPYAEYKIAMGLGPAQIGPSTAAAAAGDSTSSASRYPDKPEGAMAGDIQSSSGLKFTTGEGGIQVPEGVGVAPKAEATGIAAAGTNLVNFGTAVDTATGAIGKLGGAINSLVGAVEEFRKKLPGYTPPSTNVPNTNTGTTH